MENEVIEYVRERSDIIELMGDHTRLTTKGNSVKALCPFHQEKTPSLDVSGKKGLFYCYGCGEKGDIFSIPMKLNGLSFIESVKYVADRFNLAIDDKLDDEGITMLSDMRKALELAQKHYACCLGDTEDPTAANYLKDRGITSSSAMSWGLGYAKRGDEQLILDLKQAGLLDSAVEAGVLINGTGNIYPRFKGRVIFPIYNKLGQIVSLAGRDITGNQKAKYINGPETKLYKKSEILYGLSEALPQIRSTGDIIIVEGYLDVIALHQSDVTEAVATCGTALTDKHVKSFATIATSASCCFDPDDAGRAAAAKALPTLATHGVKAQYIELPEGTDPADFIASNEPDAIFDMFDSPKPLLTMWLQRLSRAYDRTPSGRQSAVYEAVPVIRSYPIAARDIVLREASDITGVSYMALKRSVGAKLIMNPVVDSKPSPDPISLNIMRHLITNPDSAGKVKDNLKPGWIDNQDERAVIRMLIKGMPVHEASRKAPEYLQPYLHRMIGQETSTSIDKVLIKLKLRSVERMLPESSGKERLDLQRQRMKMQWELRA